MNTSRPFLDRKARTEVLTTYALAFDHFSELEQLHRAAGNYAEEEGAHQYARVVLRAWMAEQDDPGVRPPYRYNPHDRGEAAA